MQPGVLCEGVSGEGGLFITQTSVAVMSSPSSLAHQTRLDPRLATSRTSMKYEEEEEEACPSCPSSSSCPRMCQKSHTERVVVALLLGALIIIFMTLVLSLVYLRESSQQQQYSQTMIYSEREREERLVQWAAANNVKIKPGSRAQPRPSQEEGTCQLPQCWRLGRRLMLMSDQTADPCHSFYNLACGGWLANISQHSRPVFSTLIGREL